MLLQPTPQPKEAAQILHRMFNWPLPTGQRVRNSLAMLSSR